MTDEKMFEIMDGMEEVNRKMTDELDQRAPLCHMQKMHIEEDDHLGAYNERWWECSVCGHTKSL